MRLKRSVSRQLLTISAVLAATIALAYQFGRPHAPGISDTRPPLRVLCAESWLSPEDLERFSKVHDVAVQFYSYSRPSEFLRQMANSDGNVDVICVSSLLVRSLIRSHWLRKLDYASLAAAQTVSVDLLHLPFDPDAAYGLPLYWDLYGHFGPQKNLSQPLVPALRRGKAKIWGEELNLLQVFGSDEEAQSLLKPSTIMKPALPDGPPAEWLGDLDFFQVPLARVARHLGSDFGFHLPDEGGVIEIGLLAVGEKSAHSELALRLIDDLGNADRALRVAARLRAGTVHRVHEASGETSEWTRPSALRRFQLNRLRFPDVDLESVPKFQRLFDERMASDHGNKGDM